MKPEEMRELCETLTDDDLLELGRVLAAEMGRRAGEGQPAWFAANRVWFAVKDAARLKREQDAHDQPIHEGIDEDSLRQQFTQMGFRRGGEP